MPNIGSLTVELDLQTQQYEAGLKRSKQQIVEHADSLTILQRTAQSTGNRMTAASDEIVAAWGKSGDAAQNAIRKMEAVGRSNAVNSGIRQMKAATDDIVKGWVKVGDAGEDAGKQIDYSMREAHSATKALEQMLGVHLPNATGKLIAESQLLGPALSGIFSGVALLGFIGLIRQIPEIIGSITEKVTGWNEVAKKAYEEQIKLNLDYLELSRKIENAERDRRVAAGELTSVQAIQQRIAELNKEVAANNTLSQSLDKQKEARKNLGGALGVFNNLAESAIKLAIELGHTQSSAEVTKQWTNAKEELKKYEAQLRELQFIEKEREERQKEAESAAIAFRGDEAEARRYREGIELRLNAISQYLDFVQSAAAKEMAITQNTIAQIQLENQKASRDQLGLTQSMSGLILDQEQKTAADRLKVQRAGFQEQLAVADKYIRMRGDMEFKGLAMRQSTLAAQKMAEETYQIAITDIETRRIEAETAATQAFNEWYRQAQEANAEWAVSWKKKETDEYVSLTKRQMDAALSQAQAIISGTEETTKAALDLASKLSQLQDLSGPESVAAALQLRLQAINAEKEAVADTYRVRIDALTAERYLIQSNTNLTSAQLAVEMNRLDNEQAILDIQYQQTANMKSLEEESAKLDAQLETMARQKAVVDDITNTISKLFTDSIAHGKNFWDAFGDIGKDTMASIANTGLKAMFTGFLNPWKEALDGMNEWIKSSFKKLGEQLQKVISGVKYPTDFVGPIPPQQPKGAGSQILGALPIIGTALVAGYGIGQSLRESEAEKARKAELQFRDSLLKDITDTFHIISNTADNLTVEVVDRATQKLFDLREQIQAIDIKQGDIKGLAELQSRMDDLAPALVELANAATRADQASALYAAQLQKEADARKAVMDTTQSIMDKIINPAGDIKPIEGALQNLAGVNQAQIISAVGDDIRRIGDALTAASRPIPPMIADLYNFIKAQDAVSEAAARNTEIQQAQMQALAEEAQAFAQETQSIIDRITRPAGDTRALEAALTSVGGMDRTQIIAAIGDEIKRIGDALTKAGQSIPPVIRDLYDFAKAQDEISEATSRILDINKELTSVYDDLGTALNRQLDKLDTEKQSLQQQIVDAENDAARSQLQDTLDTTSSLGEYIRTQASLNELDRKIKADKKKAELEDIQRMKDRLAAVTALQDVTNSALDSLGLQREHENDLMDSSITSLIQRGSALEDERKMLAKVTGATEMVTSAFDALLAVFYPFMEPITLKSYQHGTDFVPSTGAYLLHQGESVTPAGQKPKGGGDVTVNFNAPVIGDMDELVDRLSPALLEAHRYDVQYGSQRPAIRQRAARSNRW